jgi:hypothetical protein
MHKNVPVAVDWYRISIAGIGERVQIDDPELFRSQYLANETTSDKSCPSRDNKIIHIALPILIPNEIKELVADRDFRSTIRLSQRQRIQSLSEPAILFRACSGKFAA